MTRRAAVYVRISSDKTGAGLGVERQEADCRAVADRLGWTVVDVYSDNDLSAYSGKARPAYRRMLADLADGRVDAVVAWHPDRLHRRPVELEEFINVVDAAGAVVATATAGDLDLSTSSGRMVARLLGVVARGEVEHSIERVKAAKAQAAAAGRWRGGPRPYGFAADGCTVVDAEADVIRAATARLLTGESLRALSRELNDAAVPTSTGRSWTPQRLRQVVLRARNAGLIQSKATGEVLGKAAWPALVPPAQWRNLCRALNDPSRRTIESPSPAHLGSGVYVCGVCDDGSTLQATRNNGRRSYSCRNGFHVTRAAEPLDDFVVDVVIERLLRPDARALLVPAARHVDVEKLQGERDDIDGQLRELGELFATRKITALTMTSATTDLTAQQETLDAQLSAATATSPLAGIVDAPDVRAAWDAVPVGRQKAIVRELMVITVLPAPKGRPVGWRPGQSYFDERAVRIDWRR